MTRRVTRRLAVVTPWFGADLRGGAERQSRQIALRLAARGHAVEVLTTCARDFSSDWSANHHDPGARAEDGLTVRRFLVGSRDAAAFERANARLLAHDPSGLKRGLCPVADEDARAFVEHNINSPSLLSFLRARAADYDAIIFIPYLYGTTLRGLPLAATRAILQPCLHDEAYARLPAVAELFRRARRLLFNSEGERELAQRLYGPGVHTRARVVSEGVETFRATTIGDDGPGGRESLPAELRGARFVLYLGRRDRTKNTDLLLAAFRRFRRQHPASDLKLVLAGEGRIEHLLSDPTSGLDEPGKVDSSAVDPGKVDSSVVASGVVDSSDSDSGVVDPSLVDPSAVDSGGVDSDVVDLGVVSENAKAALLGGARALFQPSRNESFSRAMMEAWLAGRPVAAHRDCLATARAVEASGGGWLAANVDEWAELFARVAAASDRELDGLGARGHAYARAHADWDKVIDRYEAAFAELDDGLNDERGTTGNDERGTMNEEVKTPDERGTLNDETKPGSESRATDDETAGVERGTSGDERGTSGDRVEIPVAGSSFVVRRSSSVVRRSPRAVHQLLPDFVYGDAISNQAVAIREHLRARGYESEIFAARREARVAREARALDGRGFESESGLIYHHSIGSEVTAAAVAHGGPKCLVYHNVTPPEFFAPYRPGFAWLLETGRASLGGLAREFPCAVGDSPFNAAELKAAGFRAPGVLPIIVGPDKWNLAPDAALLRQLQDGRTNLLFVGRVAPNKRQDRLVRVFAEYARQDPGSRLVLAGEGQKFDPYFRGLTDAARRLGVGESVLVTGRLDDAQLLACYLSADLYLSASEHEGFGVPLVEAMWFDVPVLAARAAAVPDTVADAALLYDPAADLREVARLAKLLARDDTHLRRRLVEAGRRRREDFTPASVAPALDALVARMAASVGREAVSSQLSGGGANTV